MAGRGGYRSKNPSLFDKGVQKFVNFFDLSPDMCKLPGCNKPRYIENNGRPYDFCGKSHAEEYRRAKEEEDRMKLMQNSKRRRFNAPNNQLNTHAVTTQAASFPGIGRTCGGASHAYPSASFCGDSTTKPLQIGQECAGEKEISVSPSDSNCNSIPLVVDRQMVKETVGLDAFKLTDIQIMDHELGVGSYASVYEVNYLGLKCAGKKIHELLLRQGGCGITYALRRFEEECRLLSRLRHPNIVQFLGVYTEQGMQAPILIMEFLPTNLSSCIDNHFPQLRPEISYSILRDVALGLNYLHGQMPPIIHRDLSSNNVLLTSNMTAKISDLGVAKMLGLSPLQASCLAFNTKTPGTPAYMPPEAMTDEPAYDTSIDVFSYGVMMIHVFSGQWPVPKGGQIRMEHGRMIPVSEAERREGYLRAVGERHPLVDLILSCIDNDPQRRPHSRDIVLRLLDVVSQNPLSLNMLEMLQQIDTSEEKEEATATVRKTQGR